MLTCTIAMERTRSIKRLFDTHPEYLYEYLKRNKQFFQKYIEENPKLLSNYQDVLSYSSKSKKGLSLKTPPGSPATHAKTGLNDSPKDNSRSIMRNSESENFLLMSISNIQESNFRTLLRRSSTRKRAKSCEHALLLELSREILHTDDKDQFCFKALRHVVSIINAEKCSLFWMRDSAKGDSKELASRLWNITSKSTFEDVVCDSKNELVVPVGVGIAGHVAESKSPVNATNVYEHAHFNKTIDEKTGFESRDLLCQPLILQREDKVVGVVEVVNKKNKEPFSTADEQVLDHFLILCNLAIQNCRGAAQIARLQQAAMLQEDLSNKVSKLWASRSIDDVLKEVVLQVSELIQCERYTLAVALIDNCNIEGCLMFAKSYDMLLQKPKSSMFDDEEGEITKNVEVNKLKKNDWVFSHKVIIKAVETKQVVNVAKITPFSEFKLEDAKKEFSLKSALCVSFYDGTNRLLGVLHLGNKKKKGFDENDEAVIESVRPYIMNGLLFANGFNSIVINKAKTDVAEDTVRFHIRPWQDEVDRVVNEPIPEGEKYNLYEFTFSDLGMNDDETVLGAMRMFTDLDSFNLFHIRQETMLRWLITTRRCYRPVYYHNWRHGLNVAHTMFLLLDRMAKDTTTPGIDKAFSDREKFALVVACFCHDIDHRGTNNAFLIRAGAPLAILYNTSTLENHHYDTCLRISSIDGNNIFESFTKEQFDAACELMKHAILATDLALYFQRRNTFKGLLEKPPEERNFVTNEDNRMLLMSMMMTACDLSSITKPWEVQQKMAKLVTNEFYDQGDQERALFGTEPMPMMDRKKSGDLPKMQIGFIDGVCSMAYEMMADFCPGYSPLRDGMRANRQSWKEMAIAQGHEVDVPKNQQKKQDDEYGNLWEKYWSMDPENFIWGIDPNEVPPEVVIERVVFSPKKKVPKGTPSASEMSDTKSTKKRRKNKVSAEENVNQTTESDGKSKMCLIM